jgi:hypothetical protein
MWHNGSYARLSGWKEGKPWQSVARRINDTRNQTESKLLVEDSRKTKMINKFLI